MLRAENAEVVIHPDDRRYGALLVGSQGSGKTSALRRLLRQRRHGARHRPDRDRSQERALPHLSEGNPPGLRQAGVVPRPGPPGVRDEPAATGRRPAAADRGRSDRRQRRRRAAGHQREPDLHVQPPVPQPRGHRRDRARAARAAPRQVRGRLQPAAPRQAGLQADRRRGLRGPARPRPDRRVLPLRATRRTATGRAARPPNGSTRRATRSASCCNSHRCGGSSTTRPTSRCARSSRRGTS